MKLLSRTENTSVNLKHLALASAVAAAILTGSARADVTIAGTESHDQTWLSTAGQVTIPGGATLQIQPTAQGAYSFNNALVLNGTGTIGLKCNLNDSEYTFAGAITSTATGAQTLALQTGYGGNGDRESMIFNSAIPDGSGGNPLSLTVACRSQSGAADYVSLKGGGTFTGPISLSIVNAGTTGNLVIGGTRTRLANTVGTGTLGGGNYAGNISLGTSTILEYDSSAAQSLAGVISGAGAVQVTGGGIVTLSGANTYTGNTTVGSGGSAVIANGGGLTFGIQNTSSNKLTGAGGVTVNGAFTIDTSAVTVATGSWTLVDITSKTYGGTFAVNGFTNSSGVWTKVVGPSTWTFNQSTGVLSLNTLAVFTSFGIAGSVGVIDNNAFSVSLSVPYGTDYATLAPSFTVSSGTCNQTSASPPSPTFAAANPATYTLTDGATVHAYTVTVTSAPAPILFAASGAPLQTFTTQSPPVSEWSTLSVSGGGGDVETDAAMDTAMNAIAASSITTTIPTQAGSGTNANAYWRSSDLKLGTQPSGNKMTLLMAKLYNASGGSVDNMSVSYTFGLASVTPAEAIKGHRVYWSTTGATNSWTAAGDFLLAAPGTTTVVFNLTSLAWANGGLLYVVWADDNGLNNPDGDYTIDNVSFAPPLAMPIGLAVTPGDGQVSLSWAQYAGATSYNVKRSTTQGGTPPGTYGTVFNVPSGTSYTDSPLANGTTYYYVVSAVTGTGETPNSVELSATPSGVSVGNSTVLNSLPSLWADGVSFSTVSVTLNNASAVPMVGKTVELVSSRPSDDIITGSPGTSDANGVVVFTVKSPAAGSSDLTVTDTTDSLPITTWTEPFVASPTPLTTYLPSATILQTWDFEDSTYQGWTPNRRTYTTPAGVQLGSKVPLLADGGAMVGMMSSPALPAAMTWVDSGVEMRFNTPNVAIPTFELEFLTWVGSGGAGFAVHSPGGTSMETKEATPGANSSWAPLNSSALVGPHTLTLLRQADGTFKTYVDGTLINTMTATTAPASAPVHIGIGENEINGNAYIPIGSVVSKVTLFNVTAVASGYGAWAALYAGGGAANQDSNNDGVQNGVAYFMGMNGLATNPSVVNGQVSWPHVATDVTYKVLTSQNLADWTDVTVDAVDAGGVLTYTLPTLTPTLFVRLEVLVP